MNPKNIPRPDNAAHASVISNAFFESKSSAATFFLLLFFLFLANGTGGYSPGNLQQYGVKQALSNKKPIDGEFTEQNPLIISKTTVKAKNGSDSTYVSAVYIGKFVNGFPQGKIIQKNYIGSGDEYESYFNEKMELIKFISKEKTSSGKENVETIEFLNKCPISYDSPARKRKYQGGQMIKYQEFNTSGGMLVETNYVFDSKKKITCNYDYSSPNINGLLNGESKIWDYEGKLVKDYNYLNGEKNGICTDYKHGKLLEIQNYKNGVLNGKYILYTYHKGTFGAANNDGGRIIQEGVYENGKRTSYKLYSEDGTFKILKD